MRSVLLLCLIAFLLAACHEDDVLPTPPSPSSRPTGALGSQPTQEQTPPPFDVTSEVFQAGIFKNMPYRILFPRNYDPTKSYPLHIFLHGIGERGSDNEKQLSLGSAHFRADSVRNQYRAFVVFPQCADGEYWVNEPVTTTLRELIDSLLKHQSIDKEKISIGGFSMGAYGTFAMVARHPELFHAAIAISGDGDESKASSMARSKWRLFAGKKDDVVPSRKTEKMAKALAQAGASVSFILYPNADHGRTWLNAFSEPDFFKWIFSEAQTPIYRGTD